MKIDKKDKGKTQKEKDEEAIDREMEIKTEDIKTNQKTVECYYDYYLTLPPNVSIKQYKS